MALNPGTTLGSFEISGLLGVGGMGEVYRARDAKLGREVAIKVLPEAFSKDENRRARFEREAKLLASLNHSNIAGIHELGVQEGTHFLVMELVEGVTLDDRVKVAPIAPGEALPLFSQLAEALEYAHEQGVIHRDLKPANIKVTPEGKVKVLDFGLAKAFEIEPGDSSEAKTLPAASEPSSITAEGRILGTPAYMSPEQASGAPVDKRSDIWAFGCCFYEALSGKRPFMGKNATELLAEILRGEPDWDALPKETPARVRVLLWRCLQKDPKRRLRDIGEARFELSESGTDPSGSFAAPGATASPRKLWPFIAATVGAALAIGFVAGGWLMGNTRQAPGRGEIVRFSIPSKTSQYIRLATPDRDMTSTRGGISPDARNVLFFATSTADGVRRIWVRPLHSFEARAVPGTDGGLGPFWTEGGRGIGFFREGAMWTTSLAGGSPKLIAPNLIGLAAWSPKGIIVVALDEGPIVKVASSGGVPEPIHEPDPDLFEVSFLGPQFLPDGNRFIFIASTLNPDREIRMHRLYMACLDAPGKTFIGEVPSRCWYVEPGYLIYIDEGTILALPFDADAKRITGEPVVIGDGAFSFRATGNSPLSVADNGALLFDPPRANRELVWLDAEGHRQAMVAEGLGNHAPRISYDGSLCLVGIINPRNGSSDIWIFGLERETSIRLTFDPRWEAAPIWSADGTMIYHSRDKYGWPDLYRMTTESPRSEELIIGPGQKFARDASPDGRYLLLTATISDRTKRTDIWVLPLETGSEPAPLISTPASEADPRFSRGGDWIAYSSDGAGERQIYVHPFPGPGPAIQVSVEGGVSPVWARDESRLYYIEPSTTRADVTRLMTVDFTVPGAFESPHPELLFETDQTFRTFDVADGGKRFLVITEPETEPDQHVILNALSHLP